MQSTKVKIFFTTVVVLLFFGCKPQIVDVANIRVERQGIKIDLKIHNPNFFWVTLSDIKMNVSLDKYTFHNIVYKPKIRLAPFSEKYYPVVVDVKPMEHLATSMGAFYSLITQDSTKLTMDGTVLLKFFLGQKRVHFEKQIYIKYKK